MENGEYKIISKYPVVNAIPIRFKNENEWQTNGNQTGPTWKAILGYSLWASTCISFVNILFKRTKGKPQESGKDIDEE